MKTIEIILREVSNYESKEVIKEERIIFLRPHKLEELMKDKGLLGELLRESS